MLHPLLHRLRTTGLLATGLCALYRLAQRAMTLDITRLVWLEGTKASFKKPTDPNLTFRFLTPEDVRRFAADPTNLLDASFADQLQTSQHLCFAALATSRSEKPQLAAYAWFSPQKINADDNRGRHKNSGVGFSFPDHVLFMYKGFTHPKFRGRGLYGMVNGLAIQKLADRGITHILSTMDWTNRAARQSCQRLGFTELGLVFRWGQGHRMHTNTPPICTSLGIQPQNR